MRRHGYTKSTSHQDPRALYDQSFTPEKARSATASFSMDVPTLTFYDEIKELEPWLEDMFNHFTLSDEA